MAAKRSSFNSLLVVAIIAFIILFVSTYRFYRGNEAAPGQFVDISGLVYSKHAKCRMDCRHVTVEEVKEILQDGHEDPSRRRVGAKGDTTYAYEGYSQEKQHLRVVVARDGATTIVVTCIDLDKEWACNCN